VGPVQMKRCLHDYDKVSVVGPMDSETVLSVAPSGKYNTPYV
jgi:hypothetical protein